MILHLVSKRSKSVRQSSSSNSYLVGASCRLFSLTWSHSRLIAIVNPTITIVVGCDESDLPTSENRCSDFCAFSVVTKFRGDDCFFIFEQNLKNYFITSN